MTRSILGIVLSQHPIFERDKRIELLTQSHGRVTVIAKGAAASIKRFSGRIEPTTLIDAAVVQKPGMWTMIDCSVVEAYPHIRTSFNRISVAMYFVGLIKKMTVDHQPHPELFGLLRTGLKSLNAIDSSLESVRQHFQDHLVHLEGIADSTYQSHHFSRCFSEYTGYPLVPPVII
jgi:DNA repair protein RecO (recombination protein O)